MTYNKQWKDSLTRDLQERKLTDREVLMLHGFLNMLDFRPRDSEADYLGQRLAAFHTFRYELEEFWPAAAKLKKVTEENRGA